jgi:hypothetical protein
MSWRLLCCWLCALSLFCTASGQSNFTLHGTVVDTTGAAVPGASLRLETAQGYPVGHAIANASGIFILQTSFEGKAELTVDPYAGFAAAHQFVTIADPVTNITVVLKLGVVKQDLTVEADKSVSTDASSNADTISATEANLSKLPVFDQDFIATLTPFLDPGSIASGGVVLIVDGVEMNSLTVSPSAIQEVRINNDPYSAEFNRPGRGRIEIMTKPGTPEFHGEFNFTFRDSVFNAKNHFAAVRPSESRRIYEGHLSGPVGHGGHTSFIISGERGEDNLASVVDAVLPSGAINENVLAPTRNMQFSGRLMHDFSSSHRLSVEYDFRNFVGTNSGVGGIVLPEAGYNTNNRKDNAIFNDRLILSPHLINQLQVVLEKQDDNVQSVTHAPSVQVTGSFIGGGAQADLHRTENTFSVSEIVSWSHGKHYVRGGIQLPQFSRRVVDDQTDRLGTFKFSSLAACGSGTPACTGGSAYVFTAQQGPGRGLYWIDEFGSFIQDQIQLNPKLQLLAGLRYDWQTFLPDNNNLAPRLSLAYSPGKGKTIFRLGSGVFYDRTGGDFPATVVLHNGIVLHSIQLENIAYPLPTGISFASVPTNLVRFAPNVRTSYTIQYSAGFDRQLGKSATLSLEYRGQVQVKSFRSRDANAPILPSNPSLSANYLRPDSSFGQIQQIESGGRSLLNALDVSFRGQINRWFSGQAQYTLSRFENNTGGINWFPQDQSHPNAEWGRADVDQLSRFNLLGTINPGHWLSAGIAATLYSGTPYTETTGNDDYHTGLGNARPPGVGRNTLDAGGVASLDVLYDHDFHMAKMKGVDAKVLSISISAFNVLNRTNYTSYIGALTSPLFGQPTAALAGRQLQFAVGYHF